MAEVVAALQSCCDIARQIEELPFPRVQLPVVSVRDATEEEMTLLASTSSRKRLRVGQKRSADELFEEMELLAAGDESSVALLHTLRARHAGITSGIRSVRRRLHRLDAEEGWERSIAERSEERLAEMEEEQRQQDEQRKELLQTRSKLIKKLQLMRNELKQYAGSEERLEAAVSAGDDVQRQLRDSAAEVAALKEELARAKSLELSEVGVGAAEDEEGEGEESKADAVAALLKQASSLRAAVEEAEAEVAGLEAKQAEALESSEELVALRVEAKSAGEAAEEARGKLQSRRAELACIKAAMASAVRHSSAAGHEFGIALDILHGCGGEMLLAAFKTELATRTGKSGAEVLALVYSLVGNALIKIDRSQVDNTVYSLLM
eukprot:PLAT7172.1.p1 GENE.PLAT7172.1~~PLAT7172.1.p1  ORF type:complete len:386 (-),score=162.42 PLAT7172.1:79-1215(-)